MTYASNGRREGEAFSDSRLRNPAKSLKTKGRKSSSSPFLRFFSTVSRDTMFLRRNIWKAHIWY